MIPRHPQFFPLPLRLQEDAPTCPPLLTVTVAEAVAEPPGPLQVSE